MLTQQVEAAFEGKAKRPNGEWGTVWNVPLMLGAMQKAGKRITYDFVVNTATLGEALTHSTKLATVAAVALDKIEEVRGICVNHSWPCASSQLAC